MVFLERKVTESYSSWIDLHYKIWNDSSLRQSYSLQCSKTLSDIIIIQHSSSEEYVIFLFIFQYRKLVAGSYACFSRLRLYCSWICSILFVAKSKMLCVHHWQKLKSFHRNLDYKYWNVWATNVFVLVRTCSRATMNAFFDTIKAVNSAAIRYYTPISTYGWQRSS